MAEGVAQRGLGRDGAAGAASDLKRRRMVIWIGAAAILAIFYALDRVLGCVFFQRGGAALVIFAVLVSVLSLRARAQYGEELNRIQLEQCEIAQMMYLEDRAARPEDRLQLSRRLEPKLKSLDGRLARLAASGQRFQDLRVVEGPILILGTFVWGFGDLLVRSPGCAL